MRGEGVGGEREAGKMKPVKQSNTTSAAESFFFFFFFSLFDARSTSWPLSGQRREGFWRGQCPAPPTDAKLANSRKESAAERRKAVDTIDESGAFAIGGWHC